jgi:aminodeoxyfutalosine deaminase
MDVGQLPKVELHCHLLGVITPALLSRIQRAGGHVLVKPEELQSADPVVDLTTFRRWIDMLKPYQAATVDAMRPVLAAHVSELLSQRVVYAEIMISPTMFPAEPANMLIAFRRWREWALELEQGQIQIEFLMVIPRTLAPDLLARDVQTFITLGKAGLIVGVALVGIETGESIQRFAGAFDRWRDAGLGIEIHAGEHSRSDAVRDALDFGRPNRLGHAVSAFQDPELLARIKLQQVHVECCPTSNLRTGAIADLDDHPARHARELGLRFSLSTDNPGAFACSMNGEYDVAANAWGCRADDFAAMFEDALEARFQPALRYLENADRVTRLLR